MHDRTTLIEARLRRLVRERLVPAIYSDRRPLTISSWEVPGEPVPFAVARQAEFVATEPGVEWGRPWGTVWFRVTGRVPTEWTDVHGVPEVLIDLGFDVGIPGFQSEGTVYTPDGVILKAIESRNQWVKAGAGGEAIDLFVEAAANPDVSDFEHFEPTLMGDLATAGDAALYRLRSIDVALRHDAVWSLVQDMTTLLGLIGELSTDLPRRANIVAAMERAADRLDPHDVAATAVAARTELESVLTAPAYHSAHRIAAVGHAHIDSAWLWPVRETQRKIARTFSNVLALMDDDPDFVFAASSAQQYLWMQQYQPELFARIVERVHEGRFVPVGGMWVESDTNMPGGEAMARQFIMGKRFFMEELGVEPLEVWLPDSFGYSAALPQIVAAAGSRWFLTQKSSWNETNRMPHHTFRWEGIDGTRVFTHFPPADTYNAELTAEELARSERQYAEKGAANSSLIPFGFGNGGGGPTREMLAAAHHAHDLEGSPRVTMMSPQQFFEAAEEEYADPPVWRGELYLESHRGTYTTQAKTKRGNRRSEHLLREAELWATTRSVRLGAPYPYDELRDAWRLVLLQQFHDILPGSAIAWVHDEAERNYGELAEQLEARIANDLAALVGEGDRNFIANAGPYARHGAHGLAVEESVTQPSASWVRDGDLYVLETESIRVVVDAVGWITSFVDKKASREVIPSSARGNVLQLFRDTPTRWDGWDIDAEYTHVMTEIDSEPEIEIENSHALIVRRRFGGSTITQRLTQGESPDTLVIDNTIDWQETQKLLKLAFPVDLIATEAASEIQFGHVRRPTHANTSWDMARFETCAHRWVHVGEAGYGVAFGNDATYGHDVRSLEFDGRLATVVRFSLLRAPLYPDPESDQGEQRFSFAIRPGAGIPEAVDLGYRMNLPLRPLMGAEPVAALVTVEDPAVVVEAIKLAEDRSGDVIVRLYEAFGSRVRTRIRTDLDATRVVRTDLLERAVDEPVDVADGLDLETRPFEIVTLRFSRGTGARSVGA